MEKAGLFPKRVHLGHSRIGWLESEIDNWIAERLADRDDGPR